MNAVHVWAVSEAIGISSGVNESFQAPSLFASAGNGLGVA